MDLSSMQGLMVVVGPIVLAAVLLWAVLRNRASRRETQHTERATAANYAAEEANRKTRDQPRL